jgi:hypothetical protein
MVTRLKSAEFGIRRGSPLIPEHQIHGPNRQSWRPANGLGSACWLRRTVVRLLELGEDEESRTPYEDSERVLHQARERR